MKRSFRDPTTNVLKAAGYCDANEAGDLARDEGDYFALEPGKWKLMDDEWQPYTDANAEIQAQINAIEQETMVPRLVREGLIVMAEDLAEREAAKLTADGTPTTKEELLAANIGYQKTKAVDDQIRALRSQLK